MCVGNGFGTCAGMGSTEWSMERLDDPELSESEIVPILYWVNRKPHALYQVAGNNPERPENSKQQARMRGVSK